MFPFQIRDQFATVFRLSTLTIIITQATTVATSSPPTQSTAPNDEAPQSSERRVYKPQKPTLKVHFHCSPSVVYIGRDLHAECSGYVGTGGGVQFILVFGSRYNYNVYRGDGPKQFGAPFVRTEFIRAKDDEEHGPYLETTFTLISATRLGDGVFMACAVIPLNISIPLREITDLSSDFNFHYLPKKPKISAPIELDKSWRSTCQAYVGSGGHMRVYLSAGNATKWRCYVSSNETRYPESDDRANVTLESFLREDKDFGPHVRAVVTFDPAFLRANSSNQTLRGFKINFTCEVFFNDSVYFDVFRLWHPDTLKVEHYKQVDDDDDEEEEEKEEEEDNTVIGIVICVAFLGLNIFFGIGVRRFVLSLYARPDENLSEEEWEDEEWVERLKVEEEKSSVGSVTSTVLSTSNDTTTTTARSVLFFDSSATTVVSSTTISTSTEISSVDTEDQSQRRIQPKKLVGILRRPPYRR